MKPSTSVLLFSVVLFPDHSVDAVRLCLLCVTLVHLATQALTTLPHITPSRTHNICAVGWDTKCQCRKQAMLDFVVISRSQLFICKSLNFSACFYPSCEPACNMLLYFLLQNPPFHSAYPFRPGTVRNLLPARQNRQRRQTFHRSTTTPESRP